MPHVNTLENSFHKNIYWKILTKKNIFEKSSYFFTKTLKIWWKVEKWRKKSFSQVNEHLIEKRSFDTFLPLESETNGPKNQKPCTKTYENDEKIVILDHFENIAKTSPKKYIPYVEKLVINWHEKMF